ncbi:MAG: hypothetical protein K6E93_09490 [Bacteroidales bacterium]|nr:hypothetical protein [Bacteroidales bacterium]
MCNIETFKSPIGDARNMVGTLMIIRGVFPLNANQEGTKDYFQRVVREIADKEYVDAYHTFTFLNDPNCYMAVVIKGISDLPFNDCPYEDIIKKHLQQ